MTKKPTYEELKQRVKELEQAAAERNQIEVRLKDAEIKSRAWLEYSPVCTKIVDLDFNLKYMSSAGIKGLQIDDITQYYGKPYPFDFYPESFRNTMTKNLEKVRETGEVITQEAPVIDIEGNELWFHSTLVPVNDEKGRIDYIMIVSIDRTEQKQTAMSLRESEEKYRTLFETVALGVVYQNKNGEITSANPVAQRILGLSLDQLQGRTSYDLQWKAIKEDGSDFLGENHPAMLALESGEEIRNTLMGIFHPEKERYVWININAVPQFEPGQGMPYQVYTTFEDITERKRAEEDLQRSEAELKSIYENTPLALILVDGERRIVKINAQPISTTGYSSEEVLGLRFGEALRCVHTLGAPKGCGFGPVCETCEVRNTILRAFQSGKPFYRMEASIPHDYPDGPADMHVLISATPLSVSNEDFVLVSLEDITGHKHAEDKLRKNDLELENQARKLEESNTALKVLLEHKEREKTELEERIVSNVTELIIPFIERLKASRLDAWQNSCIGIIESNLNDIVSPFVHRLSSKLLGLTPKEIHVSTLIKGGKTNKEMADLFNVSETSIKFHRVNIRNKLGLKNKKVNLRTYLATLP